MACQQIPDLAAAPIRVPVNYWFILPHRGALSIQKSSMALHPHGPHGASGNLGSPAGWSAPASGCYPASRESRDLMISRQTQKALIFQAGLELGRVRTSCGGFIR